MSKRNSKKFSWAKRWSRKSLQSFSWQGLTTGFSKYKIKTQLLSRSLTHLSCQSTATANAMSGVLQLQNLQGWCSLGPSCSTAALLSCWTSFLLITNVNSPKGYVGHCSLFLMLYQRGVWLCHPCNSSWSSCGQLAHHPEATTASNKLSS